VKLESVLRGSNKFKALSLDLSPLFTDAYPTALRALFGAAKLNVRAHGIDVKINQRNRNRYGSGRVRLGIYSIIFALALVPFVIEVKTGIPIGKGSAYRATHDSRNWGEVWTQLLESHRLPLYLALFMVVIVAAELFFRFGKTQKDEDEDAGDRLGDSAVKPFTRLWLIATGGYTVVLMALYVYSGSEWASGMPILVPAPLVALSPILVSLGLLAIYTGEVWLRYGKLYRSRSPVIFWMFVSLAILLGIFMFLAGIGVVAR
jgi:hypothetical protein